MALWLRLTKMQTVLLKKDYLDGEEKTGCYALFVFLVPRDCCVALPRGATGLSTVCDCGNSWSYSFIILYIANSFFEGFQSVLCMLFNFYWKKKSQTHL